jgi:muramoyltetrapeptide carboxypeptidase LdcA involved in peptidoglycan recycling
MILANRLRKGDSIAFFSPSSPITANTPKRFQRAKEFLIDKGFNLIEGNLTGKKDYYRSGSISERVDEINALIRNPEVKCIISTIGGMNSNSLLPYIDYERLEKTPKIIIGYSDMTAILLGIYSRIGLITYYGPALVATFGEFSPYQDMSYDYFSDILVNDNPPPFTFPFPPFWTEEFISWEDQDRAKTQNKNELLTINPGISQGRIIGGNLNTMEGFWGSPYMPKIKDGDILFIEDSLHDIATIERSFSLLKTNNVFDKVSGIILGKHELFKDLGTNRKPHEVLLEVIGNKNIPILGDFDCSHTHPMLTLPIGVNVELDATRKTVTIIDKWIK